METPETPTRGGHTTATPPGANRLRTALLHFPHLHHRWRARQCRCERSETANTSHLSMTSCKNTSVFINTEHTLGHCIIRIMTITRWGIIVTLVQGDRGTVVGLFAKKVATPHSVRAEEWNNRITHPQGQTDHSVAIDGRADTIPFRKRSSCNKCTAALGTRGKPRQARPNMVAAHIKFGPSMSSTRSRILGCVAISHCVRHLT